MSAALPNESVVNDALKAGQMFDETQLFDEAGNAKVDAAAVGGMGAKAAEEEAKMRAKKESTGTEVETSTKYDETLRPHTRRSGRQSIKRCEPLSYGKFHRSRWSAGCSRKKPLPSEAQKPPTGQSSHRVARRPSLSFPAGQAMQP